MYIKRVVEKKPNMCDITMESNDVTFSEPRFMSDIEHYTNV